MLAHGSEWGTPSAPAALLRASCPLLPSHCRQRATEPAPQREGCRACTQPPTAAAASAAVGSMAQRFRSCRSTCRSRAVRGARLARARGRSFRARVGGGSTGGIRSMEGGWLTVWLFTFLKPAGTRPHAMRPQCVLTAAALFSSHAHGKTTQYVMNAPARPLSLCGTKCRRALGTAFTGGRSSTERARPSAQRSAQR